MYESGEDYLEAILRLQLENGFVRSVDVANKLAVSRPSVSRAMSLLEKDGFVEFGVGKAVSKGELDLAIVVVALIGIDHTAGGVVAVADVDAFEVFGEFAR